MCAVGNKVSFCYWGCGQNKLRSSILERSFRQLKAGRPVKRWFLEPYYTRGEKWVLQNHGKMGRSVISFCDVSEVSKTCRLCISWIATGDMDACDLPNEGLPPCLQCCFAVPSAWDDSAPFLHERSIIQSTVKNAAFSMKFPQISLSRNNLASIPSSTVLQSFV